LNLVTGLLENLAVRFGAGDRIREGIRVFALGEHSRFNEYLEALRGDDPLGAELLELYITTRTRTGYPALRRRRRLLMEIARRPELATIVFEILALAYMVTGEVETAENYFLRCLELAEEKGEKSAINSVRMSLIYLKFLRAEYSSIRSEIKRLLPHPMPSYKPRALYYLAILEVIAGRPHRAIEILDTLLKKYGSQAGSGVMEMRGLAFRMMGKLDEAMESFLEATRWCVDRGSTYGVLPCAKALELSKLAHLEPPPHKLIRKCIRSTEKRNWVEMAAAEEIEALLVEDEGEASEKLFLAAKSYHSAYQPMEACLAGVASAWLAWRAESSVFPKALKFLAPLLPLHPGFKKDPLLGNFMARIESFTAGTAEFRDGKGIKATLIGGFKVFVDGNEVQVMTWIRKSAIRALVYLLLSPNHRVAVDHLFYLLWPRARFDKKTRYRLYVAMDTIRKNLGRRDILSKKGDFYQLEDTWTDLGELEDLLRRANATADPTEREELLSRARELARGELLPEFPYDKHIEEYRNYYERLRKNLGLAKD
jgi:hypothetical protein